MADEYITIPEMTEASISDVDDTSVVELAVVAQSESGYATRKSTLSTLSNYVLNKFSTLLLGGTVRTVKSAIDTIVSSMGDLTNLKTTAKTNLVDAINEAAESGGSSITVDYELSSTSENPVQNKIITNELRNKVNESELANVAKSGSYDDLSNKPSIPTVDSEFSETSQNPVQNNIITNALTSFANNLAQIIGTLDNKANRSDLAEVATSGSYDDLNNKPTIPTVDSALSTTSQNPVENSAITSALNNKADSSSLAAVATSGDYEDLSNKPAIPVIPSLATVATSGNYNDLSNKPTIPSISGLQTQNITDAGGYFSTDTVEAALQQLGAELDGVATLLATI